ncbi:MAG: hypothetical protein HC809_15685 [Gammaproteobacteria bacterium]|nr:hypothetical protein [Gammaproteobacteria bacterium]
MDEDVVRDEPVDGLVEAVPACQWVFERACGGVLVVHEGGDRVTELAPRNCRVGCGIDVDAAGNGWFVDATPLDDSEYGVFGYGGSADALAGTDAASLIDLLTTILHEQGHLLGLDHKLLSFRYGGRDYTPTDVDGEVVKEILA